jgi:hypothetical protein
VPQSSVLLPPAPTIRSFSKARERKAVVCIGPQLCRPKLSNARVLAVGRHAFNPSVPNPRVDAALSEIEKLFGAKIEVPIERIFLLWAQRLILAVFPEDLIQLPIHFIVPAIELTEELPEQFALFEFLLLDGVGKREEPDNESKCHGPVGDCPLEMDEKDEKNNRCRY